MDDNPALSLGLPETEEEIVTAPNSVTGWSSNPARVTVRVEYGNGAVREYAAVQPRGFQFAVEAAKEAATGNAAGPGHHEPALLVTFSGNPEAGGMTVHSEGTPP